MLATPLLKVDTIAVYHFEIFFIHFSVDVTLFIEARDEMKPVFLNSGWMRSAPVIVHNMAEEQPIGSNVLTIQALDPLTMKSVTNFLTKSLPRQLAMDPIGNVVLTERIDYESVSSKVCKKKKSVGSYKPKQAEANDYY